MKGVNVLMKKTLSVLLIIVSVALALCSCSLPEKDKVLTSLGKYEDSEVYSKGIFINYTDYAKYRFDAPALDGNEYFVKIDESNLYILIDHLDAFDGIIEAYREEKDSYEIVVNYDFDRTLIDSEDYIYIFSKAYDPDDENLTLVDFKVYFLDKQTGTLYYFYNRQKDDTFSK